MLDFEFMLVRILVEITRKPEEAKPSPKVNKGKISNDEEINCGLAGHREDFGHHQQVADDRYDSVRADCPMAGWPWEH